MDSLTTIPASPAILVTKMCWDKTEVHRGEVVKLTTQFVNPLPDAIAQVIIYEYSPDGFHEKVESFPATVKNDTLELLWEFDYKGDISQIATEIERQKYQKHYVPVEYFFLVVIDGVRVGEGQESGLLRFKEKLNLKLFDAYGLLMKKADYKIKFADGTEKKYTTDDKGVITDASMPPGKYFVTYQKKQ
jgi:hypothetical protein